MRRFIVPLSIAILFSLMLIAYKLNLDKKLGNFLEPHRLMMGEKVQRTTVFWTELVSFVAGAYVYSRYGSYLNVILVFGVFHIVDYIIWYLDEKHVNLNILERRGY